MPTAMEESCSTSSWHSDNEQKQRMIKAANLKDVLKRDKGDLAEYTNHVVKEFVDRNNRPSTLVTSVVVDYVLNGQQEKVTYIVKIDPESYCTCVQEYVRLLFKKECVFYENILPMIDSTLNKIRQPVIGRPHCHFSLHANEYNLIYLEDLREKGFKMFNLPEGFSKEHAELAVAELARLHASSIILDLNLEPEDVLGKYSLMVDATFDVNDDGQPIYTRYYDAVLTTGAKIADRLDGYGDFSEFLKKIAGEAEDMMKKQMKSNAPFTSIIHGDAVATNFLFKYDSSDIPKEVCIVDFQMHKIGSICHDLSVLLYTSVETSVRQSHLEDLLDLYHTTYETVFKAAGVDMKFTQGDLYQEFRTYSKYALVMALSLVPVLIMDKSFLNFMEMSNGNLNEPSVQRQDSVLKMVDSNHMVKKRFQLLFDDLIKNNVMSR